jgi:hypothetical protein
MTGDTLYLVCIVDKNVLISKIKKRFGLDNDLLLSFKEGVPLAVPKLIGVELSRDYPQFYTVITDAEAKLRIKKEVQKTPTIISNDPPSGDDFDPVEFLNNNHPLTRVHLEELPHKKVLRLARVLDLKLPINITKELAIDHVLSEVEVRNNNVTL